MLSFVAFRRSYIALALSGLFTLAALIIYWRPLFFGDALYFRDLQIFFAPMKHFLGTALRDGYFPWWNPALQMGTPFLADPQSGVFYPPSWLFALVDAPRGMAISLVLHLLISQAGAYVLARRSRFEPIPAAAAALIYGLGGWSLSCSNMLTLAHSAAWAPWTIYACERLWYSPTRRSIAIAALILALQMYSGWPEMFILLGIVLIIRRLAAPRLLDAKWLIASLVAGTLAAALFAPQFLATWEAYRASVRVGGLGVNELLEFSATPAQWLSILRPPLIAADNWNIFQAFPDGHVPLFLSLHIGWLALPLIALGACVARRYSVAWLLIGGIGVFLAMGAANPLAIEILKLLNRFRSPEKYLFLVHLAAAMLAAPGLARLLNWLPASYSRLVGILLLLALASELVYNGRKIDLLAPANYYAIERSAEARLIAFEPGRTYTRSLAQDNINSVRELYTAFRNTLTPNTGVMTGIHYVNGVSFLQYREHMPVLALIDSLPPGALLARRLAFLGVRYVVTDDPAFASNAEWATMTHRLTSRLWRLEHTAQLMSFATHVALASDDALASAASIPEFAQGNSVFVNALPTGAGNYAPGQVISLQTRPGRYEAEVETPGLGWLVLRENAYPGWTATVDDQPATLIRTNRFFLGLAVPPGRHKVRFEFRPTQLDFGLLLAALAVVALLVLAFLPSRRQVPTAVPFSA